MLYIILEQGHSDPTGYGFWSSIGSFFVDVGRGLLYMAGAAILMPFAVMFEAGSIFTSIMAGNWSLAGWHLLGMVVGLFSFINAFYAGYFDIYSHNQIGFKAFISDHLSGASSTSMATFYMLRVICGGGEMQQELQKQSNAFIFSDNDWLPETTNGRTCGNVVAMRESRDNAADPDEWNSVLVHELVHTWQSRRYGGMNKIDREYSEEHKYGLGRYDTPGTLEYEAREYQSERESLSTSRPWYFDYSAFDKIWN